MPLPAIRTWRAGPSGRGRRDLHEPFGRGGHPPTNTALPEPGGPARDRPCRIGEPVRTRRTSSPWPRCCRTRTSCSCSPRSRRLTDLPWTASLVGSDDADPAYAAQVRTPWRHAWAGGPGAAHRRARRGRRWKTNGHAADLSLLVPGRKPSGWWSPNRWPVAFRWSSGRARAPWRHCRRQPASPGRTGAGYASAGRRTAGRRRRPRRPDSGPVAAAAPALAAQPRRSGHSGGRGRSRQGPAARAGTPPPGLSWTYRRTGERTARTDPLPETAGGQ